MWLALEIVLRKLNILLRFQQNSHNEPKIELERQTAQPRLRRVQMKLLDAKISRSGTYIYMI